MNTPTLSIVIPCYNEESRLHLTFRELTHFALFTSISFEIIFVDDGSTDSTAQKIEQFIQYNLYLNSTLIRYRRNRGKGYAVREGLKQSTGKYCLYSDCDFSTPLSEVRRMIPQLSEHCSIIYGIRIHYHNAVIRQMISKLFTSVRCKLFPTLSDVTDSQCGFKCMTSDFAHLYANIGSTNGFVFDLELLLLAQKKGLNSKGMLVPWQAVSGGTVLGMKTVLSVITELFQLITKKGSCYEVQKY